jgi:hypothetical protein
MTAMMTLRPFQPDARLVSAASEGSGNFRRYAQDVLLELQYADFYTYWTKVAETAIETQSMDDLRHLNATARAAQCTSQTAWDLRRLLSRVDILYGQGELEAVVQLIESSAPIFRLPEAECAKKK